MTDIYWGDSQLRTTIEGGRGELVLRDGELFYKISNYHVMAPFFVSVVSGSDHWMFVSSTGGLTCGRGDPDNALFPYYTDDKIHDAQSTTGPQAAFLVGDGGKIFLWKPFGQDVSVYDIERNLYKNQAGNKLVFEEINHDLGLAYAYSWSNSEQFGFVKHSTLNNVGHADAQVSVLDGLRNLLPYGANCMLQNEMSTLVDAYKQAESFPDQGAAVYTMSSRLSDRAEPSEALRATVVWSVGLDSPKLLLSEDQVSAFCAGSSIRNEAVSLGKRGAFFMQSSFTLSPATEKSWYVLAEINQGPCEISSLFETIDRGVSALMFKKDYAANSQRLLQLVGGADGCQKSSDALSNGRHFSNTLFNIMRGGTFYNGYRFPLDDFLNFAGNWNMPLRQKFEGLLGSQGITHTLSDVLAAAENSGDTDMERIVLEYLPLTFSRRHGDPSRPWNHFSIDVKNPDGSDKLYYQGNWRDIFQNWEALAFSYPEFVESFINKFVNASTADGYNPYRITKAGIDWEVLNPEEPWSNIGYWGDHQVNYLLKLIEFSSHYHPGRMKGYLSREIFVYADVPYRLKDYQSLLGDPKNSVIYDQGRAELIARRVKRIGSDGKLLTLSDGSIYKVNLLEKLLVTSLSKLSNFVPGGGIWMNTQRPDWNDANNALVGYGLSMVTVCYLRRFLLSLGALLEESDAESFSVSTEVLEFFNAIEAVLRTRIGITEAAIRDIDRKLIMDELGSAGEKYRTAVYSGFSGNKRMLDRAKIVDFVHLAMAYTDHSIGQSRRGDGLFHSYNLIHLNPDGHAVENLFEMLEGQVAVLSSGYLDAQGSRDLLDALRASKMYRADQNSYLLYPDKKLPSFKKRNLISPSIIENSPWIQNELDSGRKDFVEKDVNGEVHFNTDFKNKRELRAGLDRDPAITEQEKTALCDVYESVFNHHQFTGRSGTMFKYEGLGCIYWHMVSKLLLATAEVSISASKAGVDQALLNPLLKHFDDIKDGLGIHKAPALYGAFPIDPYSHTPGFTGVQQPGMTGQVKEDMISRFGELGLIVNDGQISFSPVLLKQDEFLSEPQTWQYSLGGLTQTEQLDAGSLAFCLCGVPVIYRLAQHASVFVYQEGAEPETIPGNDLGAAWSQSVFRRENRVRKIVVNLNATLIRQ
jgi:hypothetical protein